MEVTLREKKLINIHENQSKLPGITEIDLQSLDPFMVDKL